MTATVSRRESGHPSLVNFDSLTSDLYGCAPGQFVAERNAAEKQARSAGDRELAARIHQLAKPTTVGWLANQLVRRHPEEIEPLLELGAGLREATATLSREKLQELMRLQHQVIAGLIKQAGAIARDAGQRMSEQASRDLEDTLRAALADESLGKQLLEGRLTGALEPVGFTGLTGLDTATREPSPPPAATKKAPPDPRLAKAERAVTDAKAEAQAADVELQKAQQRLADSSAATRELNAKVQQLQAELDQAGKEQSQAQQTESQAQKRADQWERENERARQRLDDAVAKRDELTS
ncbi:MAG: uncharacterized protein JWN96_264 [Mycobacterium sp.]|jgi:hypothetical protein|nr:uncharacterized protein [Mycobacterium sp.]